MDYKESTPAQTKQGEMIAGKSGKDFNCLFKGAFKWCCIIGLNIQGYPQELLWNHCNWPKITCNQRVKVKLGLCIAYYKTSYTQNVLNRVKMKGLSYNGQSFISFKRGI